MKTSEQIAETVFQMRDRIAEQNRRRSSRLCRLTAAAAGVCMLLAVILLTKHSPHAAVKPPVREQDSSSADVEVRPPEQSGSFTTAAAVSPDMPAAEAMPEDSAPVSAGRTDETDVPDAGTQSAVTGTAAEQGTANSLPESAAAPQTTAATANEYAVVPHWNERTITEQFLSFTLNGAEYGTRNTPVAADLIGEKLGSVTMTGEDIYEDTVHTVGAEVFRIRGIAERCAAAVRFAGDDRYYSYVSWDYCPATLGDLMRDLGLDSNLTLGSVYVGYSADVLPDADTSVFRELLHEYRDCVMTDDEAIHRTLLSASANVPLLGIRNKSLALTEDGYLLTNMMERRYLFYIGADRINQAAEQLGIGRAARTDAPPDSIQGTNVTTAASEPFIPE